MLILSILLGCLVLYRLQALLYRKYWSRGFSVSVRYGKHQVTEGEKVCVCISVENRKWLPLPAILVSCALSEHLVRVERENSGQHSRNVSELLSVLMNQRITRSIDYLCQRRGVYRISEISVQSKDLFYHEKQTEVLGCEECLTVYPACVEMDSFIPLYQNLYGQILTQRLMQEDPFFHRGVREYQPFDQMRQIDWKATAKTGELKVYVPERTAYRKVAVFLNLQSDNYFLNTPVLEESIRLAKTVCMCLNRDGLQCKIYTNGHDAETDEMVCVEHLPPDTDYMHLVNSHLARIRIRSYPAVAGDESFERDRFVRCYEPRMLREAEDHFLVVISNYQHTDFQEALENIKRRGGNLLWLVPVGNSQEYHPQESLADEARIWNLNYESRAVMRETGMSGGAVKSE